MPEMSEEEELSRAARFCWGIGCPTNMPRIVLNSGKTCTFAEYNAMTVPNPTDEWQADTDTADATKETKAATPIKQNTEPMKEVFHTKQK